MRLFYRPGTGRPLRVAWALEEVGADYETVALDAESAGAAEHRGRHPLGRVPVLEWDDGEMLFESTSIVLAIADAFPDAGLIGPLGSELRREVYVWSVFAMTEMEKPALMGGSRARCDDAAFVARQRELFGAAADALGEQLEASAVLFGDDAFVLGDSLTAADIVIGGVCGVARFVGVLEDAPPIVSAYWERLRARPGFQRALDRTESLLA